MFIDVTTTNLDDIIKAINELQKHIEVLNETVQKLQKENSKQEDNKEDKLRCPKCNSDKLIAYLTKVQIEYEEFKYVINQNKMVKLTNPADITFNEEYLTLYEVLCQKCRFVMSPEEGEEYRIYSSSDLKESISDFLKDFNE